MDPKLKRTHNIHFRLSEPEYDLLKFKLLKSGQSIQSFMWQAIYDTKVTSISEIEERKKQSKTLANINRELREIGKNINQMTQIAKRYGTLPTSNDLMMLNDDISILGKELKDIWQLIKQSIHQPKHMVH